MTLPVMTRARHEELVCAMETEIWDLRRKNKELRERERARMVCVSAIEQDAADARRELEQMQAECAALRERVQLLGEDNRELRRRYDTARAELTRTTNEVRKLRLMRAALEARVAAPCEVEVGA